MSFINWGNETPEQKAIRDKMEQQALYEQAVRMRLQSMGYAGGSAKVEVTTLGQTGIYVYKNLEGTFQIGFADFEMDKFGKTFNTGLNENDNWFYNNGYYSGTYIVQNKGYAVVFSNNSNQHNIYFFNAGGNHIDTLSITTIDLAINSINGDWIVLSDYDAATVWWFDGDTLRSDSTSFVNSMWGYDGEYNLEGFFFTSIDTGSFYNFFFNDGTGFENVYRVLMTDEPDMVYQYDAYSNSNIFRISKYDNASDEYNRIIYLANDGSSLHEIDLSGNGYDNHFIDNYGTGKHLDTFLSDSNYHICYYDSVRNNLIERDHGKGSNYPSFIVHKTPVFKGALTDWPTDRCLIQISDYNGDGPDHDLFPVTYCDLIAVLDNPEDLNDMYTFADNESKLISFDQVHVADSIFVPFCPDATAVPKELSVKIFASNGNVGTTPLTDFDSFDSLDYYKIGNRYLLWAIAYGNPDSANIYLFSENGSESATIEVTNTNCFYSEWDRNTLVWRDDSEIDPTTYYLNAYETSINSPGTIDPFGRVEYTTSYATPDGLYPGNLFLQGGSSARLYRFNDVAPDSGNGIDDGGADMYNEGNLLVSSIAGNIPYTHTQMDGAEYDSNDEAPVEAFQMDGAVRSGASYFGGSSQYFTNLYPGLFVCVAKSIDIENFSIQGTTGMNSCGFNRTSYYDTTIGGIQYRAFLKTTNGGGDYFDGGSDPTINQIIIVDSQSGSLVQTIGETTADDLHKIEGFVAAEVGEIHYLLLSTYNKSVQQSLSDSEFHSIVDTYLTRVSGLTITATLSTLNAQYSVITNLLGTEDTYWTGVLRNNDYSYVETPYFAQMELGENICGGLYYNSESKICVNLYDLDMNLISTYTADEVEYNTFRIIGDRAYIETRNGDQKFLAIQKGTGFVRKEYDWNSNRWIRVNDYPYWT